ncbi:MAG TPA: DUF5665 domain-containing protein [Candidatus Saccharibacteria bacterium]|nr:DUF5665 domain-containing protein [Candidatus Saccharibacteria bacterium]HMT39814.1 DUF5665 domain-containing protein [Candidatus Saccharibacteria bacterium]
MGAQSNNQKGLKDVVGATGLDSINEIANNKRKLFWLNMTTGFTRGFFGVLGAAFAVVLVGFLVAQLGWLPYIGDFLQNLGSAL